MVEYKINNLKNNHLLAAYNPMTEIIYLGGDRGYAKNNLKIFKIIIKVDLRKAEKYLQYETVDEMLEAQVERLINHEFMHYLFCKIGVVLEPQASYVKNVHNGFDMIDSWLSISDILPEIGVE
jgi:hypothetical protein